MYNCDNTIKHTKTYSVQNFLQDSLICIQILQIFEYRSKIGQPNINQGLVTYKSVSLWFRQQKKMSCFQKPHRPYFLRPTLKHFGTHFWKSVNFSSIFKVFLSFSYIVYKKIPPPPKKKNLPTYRPWKISRCFWKQDIYFFGLISNYHCNKIY